MHIFTAVKRFFMDDTTTLFLGLIFGSIGFGFFLYGKKQKKVVPLLVGIILMTLPYFVPNLYLLSGIGIALIALPYFVRQ